MNTVICSKCEHTVNANNSWCVIDTKTKSRTYECKQECLQRLPLPSESKVDIEIPSTMIEPAAEDWASSYPKQGIFQRITNWFYRSTWDYERVKLE